jgi:hypothetical protein
METTGIALAELDMEIGEYLPAREVMWCGYTSSAHQSNTAIVGSGDGNQSQEGFIALQVGVLNGSFDGNGDHTNQGNGAL